MPIKQGPGTRDIENWSNGQLRGTHFKPRDKYTLYHRGQEGRIELTYKELCKLSEMVEQMIADAK